MRTAVFLGRSLQISLLVEPTAVEMFLVDLLDLFEVSLVNQLSGPVDGLLDLLGVDFVAPNGLDQVVRDDFEVLFEDEGVVGQLGLQVQFRLLHPQLLEFLHCVNHFFVENHFEGGSQQRNVPLRFHLVQNALYVLDHPHLFFEGWVEGGDLFVVKAHYKCAFNQLRALLLQSGAVIVLSGFPSFSLFNSSPSSRKPPFWTLL